MTTGGHCLSSPGCTTKVSTEPLAVWMSTRRSFNVSTHPLYTMLILFYTIAVNDWHRGGVVLSENYSRTYKDHLLELLDAALVRSFLVIERLGFPWVIRR